MRGRECYKARFYGIESHRCLQMTPAVAWCQHRCIFCWRPIEHTKGSEMKGVLDEPKLIVDASLDEQKRLVSGYKGHPSGDPLKIEEAFKPTNVAISLAGEPTTYPFLPDLIEEYKNRDMSVFLVTNGQNPDVIPSLNPSQLYLSLIAYDEDLYRRVNIPQYPDGWERLMLSLDAFRENPGKKVIRITLVRGYNLGEPEMFARHILRAEPDFIEPKGYVHVGYSRRRLQRNDMPSLEEVLEFSRRLSVETGYEIVDHAPESKVALLKRP